MCYRCEMTQLKCTPSSNSLTWRHTRCRTVLLALVLWSSVSAPAASELDLAGTWRFRLDREDTGLRERWFAATLPDAIRLPGSIQEQEYGDDITADTLWVGFYDMQFHDYPFWYTAPMYAKYREPGKVVFPYWLQPEKYYLGRAWFQRTVSIPAAWQNRSITLQLERCHWQTMVWIDGHEVGSSDSLCVPHVFDGSAWLAPGEHTITIAVDNRMIHEVGTGAHSVTDYTQSAWNGIIGGIRLHAEEPTHIARLDVFPDAEERQARIQVAIAHDATQPADDITLDLVFESYNVPASIRPPAVTSSLVVRPQDTEIETTCALGADALLWDEFQPALYRLTATLRQSGRPLGVKQVSFGLRDVTTSGTQFMVNGRKTFLRGTLECCIFPLTGYPATDVSSWRRIMDTLRAYGLNHMRFHSWCPPEAAFVAADEAGVYLQAEAPFWSYTGAPGSDTRAFFTAEWQRILREYGNHPSFVLFAFGNEGRADPEDAARLLAETKQADPRRLYTGFSNGTTPSNSDFDVEVSLDKNSPNPERLRLRVRMQGAWPPRPEHHYLVTRRPDTMLDYDALIAYYAKPLIQHETVQRNSYPRISDIAKYIGAFSPGYLIIARDQLRDQGMLNQNEAFIAASGAWQVQQFKAELEAALHTRGLGGFQMLDLHDFPGQGTALVGVLDAFWDDKGYCPPEVFREFCNDTVLLARIPKFEWHPDEAFGALVRIAHYGRDDLPAAVVAWSVRDAQGKTVASGSLPATPAAVGDVTDVDKILLPLEQLPAPAKYTLVTELRGATVRNRWDFWTYPRTLPDAPPANVTIAGALDAAAIATLEQGRRVLLLPSPSNIAGDVKPGFTSIYWDNPWTAAGEVDTLGLLCDPAHPAFASFPTDSHTNWQWYDPMLKSKPMILDALPQEFRPLIGMIDDWNRNRRLGVVLEARVGTGTVIVCSIDIETDIANRPVARQLRHSLLRYLASEDCRPSHELSIANLRTLFD